MSGMGIVMCGWFMWLIAWPVIEGMLHIWFGSPSKAVDGADEHFDLASASMFLNRGE